MIPIVACPNKGCVRLNPLPRTLATKIEDIHDITIAVIRCVNGSVILPPPFLLLVQIYPGFLPLHPDK
jgi:hypothetical protein